MVDQNSRESGTLKSETGAVGDGHRSRLNNDHSCVPVQPK